MSSACLADVDSRGGTKAVGFEPRAVWVVWARDAGVRFEHSGHLLFREVHKVTLNVRAEAIFCVDVSRYEKISLVGVVLGRGQLAPVVGSNCDLG